MTGDRLVVEVDGIDFAEDVGDVFLVAEDFADGRGDVRGAEGGGGHLIEQRLEEVVVAAVDESDAGGRVFEGLGGGDAAEAAADDDDAFFPRLWYRFHGGEAGSLA